MRAPIHPGDEGFELDEQARREGQGSIGGREVRELLLHGLKGRDEALVSDEPHFGV